MGTVRALVVLLAGLQALPKEPFEAARVDGASPWVAFRTLTIPMLLPFLIIVGAFRGIDSLKIFDLIYATTQGGPVDVTNTLAITTYFQAIRWTNFGTAMSYAIVLWAMCYILAFILIRRWRKAAPSASARAPRRRRRAAWSAGCWSGRRTTMRSSTR